MKRKWTSLALKATTLLDNISCTSICSPIALKAIWLVTPFNAKHIKVDSQLAVLLRIEDLHLRGSQ